MKPTDDPGFITEVEHETWERCASEYMSGFGALVGESVGPLLDAAGVCEGSRVLDVGTGPGLVAAAASDRGADATGIDFCESMVAEAKRRFPKVTYQQANAESLPFEDGEFDAVVANFVMHHVARPGEVLTEVHRVLKDGGKVAFTVWADLTKLAGFGLFLSAFKEHAAPDVEVPHGPLFGVSDPAVFHGLMGEAGFEDSTVSDLDITWRIESVDDYLKTFGVWANLDALPGDVRKAVEGKVREVAEAGMVNGVLTLANPGILVCGCK